MMIQRKVEYIDSKLIIIITLSSANQLEIHEISFLIPDYQYYLWVTITPNTKAFQEL